MLITQKGQGRIQFPNGDVYDGHLKDGKMQGYGTLVGIGFKYQGPFQNGMKHGPDGVI